MKLFVGTSGWAYPWNKGRSLSWYVNNTPFNSIELNSSFYRIPDEVMIKRWATYKLTWSVKVHRKFTHVKRLKDVDLSDFFNVFKPLSPAFYLFQLPPSFKRNDENLERISKVAKWRNCIFEFRDKSWLSDPPEGIPLVSIDSPIGSYVFPGRVVYLRIHGRSRWYFHEYSEGELLEIAERVKDQNPEEVYVFFNNDKFMLENGKTFLKIMKDRGLDSLGNQGGQDG
ncbi:MAG: DUF72 domain-containing protein [Metallosphaera sp.]